MILLSYLFRNTNLREDTVVNAVQNPLSFSMKQENFNSTQCIRTIELIFDAEWNNKCNLNHATLHLANLQIE